MEIKAKWINNYTKQAEMLKSLSGFKDFVHTSAGAGNAVLHPQYGAQKQLSDTWGSSLCCQVLQRSQWEEGKCVNVSLWLSYKNQVIFRLLRNFGFLQDMNYTCRLSTRRLLFCPHNQKSTALRPPWHHDPSPFKRALAKSKNSQLGCDTSDRRREVISMQVS